MRELGEIRLARLEVGGSDSQHPLDGRARVADVLLAPLDVVTTFFEAARMLLELAPPLGKKLLETLLGVRRPPSVRATGCLSVGLVPGATSSCARSSWPGLVISASLVRVRSLPADRS